MGLFSGLTSLQGLYFSNHVERKAETEGIAVPAGICDRTIQVQKSGEPAGGNLFRSDFFTVLYFPNNELESLPEGIFSGLTSLQWLYLHNNDLASLPEGIFSGLTSLQRLYLHNNKLAELAVGIFSDLTSLEVLYLDASFQQEKDRIRNEVGQDVGIIFEGRSDDPSDASSDDPWYKFW